MMRIHRVQRLGLRCLGNVSQIISRATTVLVVLAFASPGIARPDLPSETPRYDFWVTNEKPIALAASDDGSIIYLAGAHDSAGPITGSFAAVSADSGSPFESFLQRRMVGHARTMAPDGEGGWWVAGDGLWLDGAEEPSSGVSLLHFRSDGSLAIETMPVVAGSVHAMELVDGTLLLAGEFEEVAGEERNSLAAIDAVTGALLPWAPSVRGAIAPHDTGIVYDIDVDGSVVYLGGRFHQVNGVGQFAAAALDITTGELLPWNPGMSSGYSILATVKAIDDEVFIGGAFSITGSPAQGLGDRLRLSGGELNGTARVERDAYVIFEDDYGLAGRVELAGTNNNDFGNLGLTSGTHRVAEGAEIEATGWGSIERWGSGSATLINDGVISASGSSDDLNIQSTVTLENNGTLRASNNARLRVLGQSTSNGTIEATSGGTVTLVSTTNIADETLTGGTWIANANSTLAVSGGQITTNAADIRLNGSGSRFDAINSISQNQGSLAIDGERVFSTSGSLTNEGTLSIGPHSQIDVATDFSQSDLGLLSIEVDHSSLDLPFSDYWVTGDTQEGLEGEGAARGLGSAAQSTGQWELGHSSGGSGLSGALEVAGVATLNGVLEVTLADGFDPLSGFEFTALTYAQVLGAFDEILLPDLGDPGLEWLIDIGPTELMISVVGIPVLDRSAPVPAPGPAVLTAIGVLWTGSRRRR